MTIYAVTVVRMPHADPARPHGSRCTTDFRTIREAVEHMNQFTTAPLSVGIIERHARRNNARGNADWTVYVPPGHVCDDDTQEITLEQVDRK